MEIYDEMTEGEREVEQATGQRRLLPARSLAGDLARAACRESFIEVALGQYQLAVEQGASRWVEDFRRACQLYLPAEVIERRFPGVQRIPGGPEARAEGVPIFPVPARDTGRRGDVARDLLTGTWPDASREVGRSPSTERGARQGSGGRSSASRKAGRDRGRSPSVERGARPKSRDRSSASRKAGQGRHRERSPSSGDDFNRVYGRRRDASREAGLSRHGERSCSGAQRDASREAGQGRPRWDHQSRTQHRDARHGTWQRPRSKWYHRRFPTSERHVEVDKEGDLHVQTRKRNAAESHRSQKRRPSTCPVAGCRVNEDELRDHVYTQHIPVVFRRQRSGMDMSARLHRRRIQMLGDIAQELGMEEVTNLMDLVNRQEFSQPSINAQLRREMEALCRAGNWPVPEDGFRLSPLNSVAGLLHWRPLAHLLGRLSARCRTDLKDKYSRVRKPQPNAGARWWRAGAKRSDKELEGVEPSQGPSILQPSEGQDLMPSPEVNIQEVDDAGVEAVEPPSQPTPPTINTASVSLVTTEGTTVQATSMLEFQQMLTQPLVLVSSHTQSPEPMEVEVEEHKAVDLTPMNIVESVGVTNSCVSPEMDYLGTPSPPSHSGPKLALSPGASMEALLRALSPTAASKSPGGEPAEKLPVPSTASEASAQAGPLEVTSKRPTYAAVASELARTGVVEPQLSPKKHETSGTVDALPEAWDSHFHLDRMARDLGRSWAQMQKSLNAPTEVEPDHKVALAGGVMIFCDPNQFHHLPTAIDMRFAVAIGVHPKKVASLSANRVAKLKELVEAPRVTGLGEVGLDYSHPRNTWEHQEKVLHQVLGYCQSRHTLVIHMRGSREERHLQAVSRRCLEIVREHCPPEQCIHLHSFSGGAAQLRDWTMAYPNCYVGFTGLVQRFDRMQRDTLKQVRADRLLVETDSPYLPMMKDLIRTTPAYIGEVASLVARIRMEPLTYVLKVTRENGLRAYRM
ncbi:MAG: TatD family hydrolase [Sedimenticola sp.]